MVIDRFNIFLVRLDPATGAETAKPAPAWSFLPMN